MISAKWLKACGVFPSCLAADVPFLAEQANVVAQGQEPFEKFGGLCAAAGAQESVDEPEGAGEKDALGAGQTVVAVFGSVAQHETVCGQVALDGVDGTQDAGVVRREEADSGDQEQAGIECGAAVGLHERVHPRVEAVLHDVPVDGVPQVFPPLCRSGEAELSGSLDHPVHGDPGHDFGVDEMPSGSAHLPEPVVGLVPGAFEVIHQRSLDVPGSVRVMQQRVAGEGQTVEDFSRLGGSRCRRGRGRVQGPTHTQKVRRSLKWKESFVVDFKATY